MITNTLLWLLVTILTICIISGLYLVLVSLYEHHIKGIRDKFQPNSFGNIFFTFLLGFVLPVAYVLGLVAKIGGK